MKIETLHNAVIMQWLAQYPIINFLHHNLPQFYFGQILVNFFVFSSFFSQRLPSRV